MVTGFKISSLMHREPARIYWYIIS